MNVEKKRVTQYLQDILSKDFFAFIETIEKYLGDIKT